MKKQNVRTLSLIVCTFTYLLIGAAVFDALESKQERRRCDILQDIEVIIKRKYNISEDDYRVMETVVLKMEPHKAGQQWKFAGAFYYATTVLTTIGYGHSTPATVAGKLFTMFYAMVGIPLGLVMFQSIGERVNRLSSVVIRSVKSSLHCRQTTASELDLICVVTTLSSLTIAGGAAAFSRYEGWTYFDSVYYCFITLTTIGFGDMVALQNDRALENRPEYVAFALIFILFGLAIVAASLNLLVLRFVTMNTEDERRDEAQAMQALQEATAFSRYEGWTYFDSVYYCFITLTTIGFGDMVALQNDRALENRPEYVAFALIFILFGLAIVAASLNLLVLRFVTMNTEDERRDETQAMQALQGAVRLEGDVITANGSILSGQLGHICTETTSLNPDEQSVCSCHCPCFANVNMLYRYSSRSRESPPAIQQMLSTVRMREAAGGRRPEGPHDSQMLPPALSLYPHKRASI